MTLSGEDLNLFYKLHASLMFYVSQKLDLVRGITTVDEFRHLPIQERLKVRDALVDRLDLIDSFVKENPLHLSADELEIILSWKNMVKDNFFVFRYLTKHTVFLDTHTPPKAYGVLALFDSFEDMLGPYLPVYVETVLLPFKGQIVYDGLLNSYRITFGSGMRTSLNESYQEAKARFGIITSLPFSVEKAQASDADILRAYLKTARSRDLHWEEISQLIHSDPGLMLLYHQEMGKVHARSYAKQLREIGIADAWFAIVAGLIVASGKTKSEVERIAREVLPPEKEKFAYIFHFKG